MKAELDAGQAAIGQWFVMVWIGIQAGAAMAGIAANWHLPDWSVWLSGAGAVMAAIGLVGMAFGRR